MEVWKDIPGYEGLYQVSNMGRVMSLNYNKTGKARIMKLNRQKNGYQCIYFKGKSHTVHKLVWITFNGPVPSGLEINHIEEDKSDNSLENLNLLTHKDNCNWGTIKERLAVKKSKPILQYSKNGELIAEYPSIKEASYALGYKTSSNILSCLKGRRKTSCGYIWKYKY